MQPVLPLRGYVAAMPATSELRDSLTAMTPRFNFVFRWFAKRFFREICLDDATVARQRALEADGSVVYVMRYASRLDYFLMNWLFVRHGLRLSAFANGIHFDYYQPLHQSIAARWRAWVERRRLLRTGGPLSGIERDRVRRALRAGSSLFVFLRTERLGSWLRGRRHVATEQRSDLDLLAESVDAAWGEAAQRVALVPLALFWRKGPRSERRFLNLAYGSPTRPSDFAKVASFLANYQNLAVKVGEPIDLTGFAAERESEGQAAVVRKVRRSILVFLFREEKVVEGPTLRPRHKVQETVLAMPSVQEAIAARAAERGGSPEAARADAEKIFREIAASMNSTLLAVLSIVVSWIFRRLFVSIETSGIEKVAEYAKRHPIVLVPSHRSYFDFLFLSWIFYAHHLVPPHILARENMAFGPFGYLFRRAGAFFMRRSLDDPLYKEVFRSYVSYLVKEGFTQEFFIEGTRSRTGRTLAPKLGFLSWNLEGFLAAPQRRDLFFVPIAITYERLVEEGSMIEELGGAAKRDESMMGLVRARKVLQRRWGSAHLSFGEPISLADALGDRRARFAAEASEDDAAEKRRFVEELANRIVERINAATIANATAVAACAFLGETRRGLLRHELTARMQEIVDLLRLEDARITPALLRDQPIYDDAIAFLVRSDLVRTQPDPRGEILYYDEGKRRVLDLYRNAILHFVAPPSFLARKLLAGGTAEQLRDDLRFWLDFFHCELFTPRGLVLAAHFDAYLDYFERQGAIERSDGIWRATEKGAPYLRRLSMQTRGLVEVYAAAFRSVLDDAELGGQKKLTKRLVEAFARDDLLGAVAASEVSNEATFQGALEALVRRDILVRDRPQGARESVYARGPAFDELAGLAERLAGAGVGR
jgi:glycerol-3-phosphate O-acyltransferase